MKILAEPVLSNGVSDAGGDATHRGLPLDISTQSLENAPRFLGLLLVILSTGIILILAGLDETC